VHYYVGAEYIYECIPFSIFLSGDVPFYVGSHGLLMARCHVFVYTLCNAITGFTIV
jgi:hypothetical protein